jgi:hypothetical protein
MEQNKELLETIIRDEFTVSEELLWLRHGDSSRTQSNGNVCRWKPVPEGFWRDSGRLSACCSEWTGECEKQTEL